MAVMEDGSTRANAEEALKLGQRDSKLALLIAY